MKVLLISLTIALIYIFFIPSVLYLLFMPSYKLSNNSEISYDGGPIVNINHGDNLAVSVKRPRWYGTIYESNENADLYLFNIINLPLKVEGKKTGHIHALFFLGLTFINIYAFKKKKSIKHEVLYE